MPRTPTGESVLARGARVVEAFDAAHPVLSVTEIAQRTGLHLATASRLAEELVKLGWLARDPQRRLRLGMRLWEVATRAAPTLSLREAALPVMEDLRKVMGHHVQLAVLDGEEVLFLERLGAPGAVINYSRTAGRLPAHASSSGLVLLAHATPEVRERAVSARLERFTEATITSAEGLRRAIAEARRQGFALLRGHVHEDAAGIAVPLRDPDGTVVAALSLIVPNDDVALARVPLLQAAALTITRAMRTAAPPSS
ncbi:IclR family transcriptional regulator [Sinomonas sp. ASV486]|uniref:IclR family transcriptional regulator n=1 Tax=Sinomonas sp. ASV486 TaxID=3051170 RepID=UPI0027DCD428|nr:IclR family transcriptional regulator [Sinomonas sp. ASV486]MDQ4491615.1 IclR family transcriptional regulator [Sinomonas sp. ASV486]